MCGIGLIASGLRLTGPLVPEGKEEVDGSRPPTLGPGVLLPRIQDLCGILESRGPDQISTESVVCNVDGSLVYNSRSTDTSADFTTAEGGKKNSAACLQFVGASLQLRGDEPVRQPLRDQLNNILVYNGEIYDGLPVKAQENDGVALLSALRKSCSFSAEARRKTVASSDTHIIRLLSSLRGPWALIYWQAETRTLWFGRDAIGRRSLLIHWPSNSDARLLLSSVAPQWLMEDRHLRTSEIEHHEGVDGQTSFVFSASLTSEYWEELPPGIYSICFQDPYHEVQGYAQAHQWEDLLLRKLVSWERGDVVPSSLTSKPAELIATGNEHMDAADKVLVSLQRAVKLRTSNIREFKYPLAEIEESERKPISEPYTPLSILFSGGLDSMILAALADQSLPMEWGIDLLNVSFEGGAAPDRRTAIAGLAELRIICPQRSWRLVEVDADMRIVDSIRPQVLTLISPAKTHMDLNIGTAIWLASRGQGVVDLRQKIDGWDEQCASEGGKHAYQSTARVVLIGTGADEQCGGYGRYRTKFKLGGWTALQKEMQVDMQRIWKRNLGRDDRCIGDHGVEARFPYLDEEVMSTLLDIPLWEIADLTQPPGLGDKKILREVALRLGMKGAFSLPKRAIQFGSRIARESNKKEFGSNRAANLVSAGSATVNY